MERHAKAELIATSVGRPAEVLLGRHEARRPQDLTELRDRLVEKTR